MDYGVTLSSAALRQIVPGLSARPGHYAVADAGVARQHDRVEFLVHRVHWVTPGQTLPGSASGGASVLVLGVSNPAALPDLIAWGSGRLPPGPGAVIVLGVGPAAGHVNGMCRTVAERLSPMVLRVVGPGLPCVRLRANLAPRALYSQSSSVDWSMLAQLPITASVSATEPGVPSAFELWSRTIGVLGGDTWRRLTTDLRIAVIGCGRTGSLLATALVRLGVCHLTLIDGDHVELHNLGEGEGLTLADAAEARPKVEALAAYLRRVAPHVATDIDVLPQSVISLDALNAIKAADVLISAVDNPEALLATGFLAQLYLKPLLTVGTGIFRGDAASEVMTERSALNQNARGPQPRDMGLDVRLILPDRCLLCLDGIADLRAVLASLSRSSGEAPARPWHEERAGSLRSLNTVASGLALRLLEDLVDGRIGESVWVRLRFGPDGMPALERPAPLTRPACPLCGVTALGDAGLPRLRTLDHSA